MHRTENPRVTHDFDFLIGEWTVHNRRLRDPLTGSTEWYETPATARATTFQNGSISVDEMWYPELGFAANSIRLFSPDERTWTIYWVAVPGTPDRRPLPVALPDRRVRRVGAGFPPGRKRRVGDQLGDDVATRRLATV